MPEEAVRADIAAGRLVRLGVPESRQGAYPLQVMYRSDLPPGKAGVLAPPAIQDQAADAAAADQAEPVVSNEVLSYGWCRSVVSFSCVRHRAL
jgi:hypothetical protein